MSGFKKGNTHGKGRPKGSRNKITRFLKDRISDFLDENWQAIENDFQELEPKDRIDTYLKLISYVLPKPKFMHLQADNPVTVRPIFNIEQEEDDLSVLSYEEQKALKAIREKLDAHKPGDQTL